MVSKTHAKPPLSIEIEEDAKDSKKEKSLIYKPEIKGNVPIQNYSTQAKPVGKPGKSPITL